MPLRVWLRAPLIINKFQIISHKNKNSQKIKLQILKLIKKTKYKNLNPIKRPISAVTDNIEVRNAKNIVIKTNQKIKFNLLYDQSRSL